MPCFLFVYISPNFFFCDADRSPRRTRSTGDANPNSIFDFRRQFQFAVCFSNLSSSDIAGKASDQSENSSCRSARLDSRRSRRKKKKQMDADETTAFAVHVPQAERIEPAVLISSLTPNQHQIALLVIVLRIQANPQKTRDGHEIHSLKIADRSGSVTFNVWNKTGELIRPGDILRLQNCITQVFRNELCVKPGRSSLLNEKNSTRSSRFFRVFQTEK